jgi:uncharacterized membrane protein
MLSTLLMAAALALVALGAALWGRKIPPNRYLGLRTPGTLSSRRVWYGANARAGASLCWLGALLFGLGLAQRLALLATQVTFVAFTIVMNVGLAVVMARGLRAAAVGRATRSHAPRDERRAA